MSDVHCFTSATFGYLDRVRVLLETVRRHHPDWTFWLCLPDEPPPGLVFDAAEEGFDHVVAPQDLGIGDLPAWVFQHDIVELCTAVKGPMLRRLLDAGAGKVVYLDPDLALFSDLSPVEALLDRYSVVLTPHLLQPESDRQGVLDNEIGALRHGIYNLGFLAVANSGEGRRFAAWWSDRLLEYCFDDVAAGLFTDQRWCDHVPAFFDAVHVLRDPGYNVASWNIAQRPIEIGPDGIIRAAGHRLRFFHFTKLRTVGRAMLERNAGDQVAAFELLAWYERRLAARAVTGLPDGWWAYGTYADGTPVPPAHRRAYRMDPALRRHCPDPLRAGHDHVAALLRQAG
jgi:hypothetical protein